MEVKIRVGAAIDPSLRTAFRPLVQSAIDARRQILREFAQVPREISQAMGGIARAQGGTFRGATAEARAAFREQTALARQAAKEQAQAAREKLRAEREVAREYARVGREGARAARELERERVAAARRANRELLQEHRALERELARAARAARIAQARQDREIDRFATRTSYHAARFITPHMPIASLARRAGSEVLRGFGVDPTFAGAMQRNIAIEDAAVAFSNQARLAGQEVAPGEFKDRVLGVRKRFGLKGEQSAGALLEYQKMTGSASEAFSLFEGLAERSARSSIDFNQLGAAAGNISKALGDIPNKGKAVLDVLDTLTVQTTKGAIEMSDLQTQVAKFTAPARQIEGDAGVNTARLAAIAQIARDVGGAASPQQAATAVSSLMNTFDKSARVKAFQNAGITMRNGQGLLRDPFELIKAAIVHTRGDSTKLNSFIMDAQAKRAARGFLSEYNRAGGGAAGERAMDALMANYMGGNISDETKRKNLAQHQEKTSTKVEKFQAALDEIAEEVAGKILPALQEAQPAILRLVTALGDATAWAVNNPGKAITAAILASIARAGIESLFRAGLERIIVAVGAAALGKAGTASLTSGAVGALPAAGAGAGAAGAGAAGLSAASVGLGLAAGLAGGAATIAATKRQIGAERGGASGFARGAGLDVALGMASGVGAGGLALAGLGLYQAGRGLFGYDSDKPQPQMLARSRSGLMPKARPDEVANYVAKDPKTTQAQLREAYARGGIPELEKLATAQQKTTDVAQRQVEQTQELNATMQNLNETIKGLKLGGSNDPSVDPSGAGYQQ